MGKYIYDENNSLWYGLQGDYYIPCLTIPEEEQRPIGVWGQRHLRYLKQHRRAVYGELLTSGRLNGYLANLDEQAEDMFFRLVNELAEKDGITEKLKTKDQMLWVQSMNTIRETAIEIVNHELIYT